MARDDWYRNRDWNPEVEVAFEAKLRRARDKAQYLRIQASYLRESRPEIALFLLERYFTFPDHFDAAQAHVDRAEALLTQGKLSEAICAYECAISREAEYPRLKTQAYLDLPLLIATNNVAEKFEEAEQLLRAQESRLMFPVDHFKWNAALAIISASRGDIDSSRMFACEALSAAAREQSGLRYHQSLGLVDVDLGKVKDRMRELSVSGREHR